MSEAPDGMIHVDEYAKLKGLTSSKVIEMIREGFYVGRKVGEDWYVDSSESKVSASKPSKSSNLFSKSNATLSSSDTSLPHSVVITDIQMPFASMVVFMVKWAIAAIPAFIILLILTALFSGVLGILFGAFN